MKRREVLVTCDLFDRLEEHGTLEAADLSERLGELLEETQGGCEGWVSCLLNSTDRQVLREVGRPACKRREEL